MQIQSIKMFQDIVTLANSAFNGILISLLVSEKKTKFLELNCTSYRQENRRNNRGGKKVFWKRVKITHHSKKVRHPYYVYIKQSCRIMWREKDFPMNYFVHLYVRYMDLYWMINLVVCRTVLYITVHYCTLLYRNIYQPHTSKI